MTSAARLTHILLLIAGVAVLLVGMGAGVSIYRSTGVHTYDPENRTEIKRMVVDATWNCYDYNPSNAGRQCDIDKAAIYLPRDSDLPVVLVLAGIGLIGASGAVAVGGRRSLPADA